MERERERDQAGQFFSQHSRILFSKTEVLISSINIYKVTDATDCMIIEKISDARNNCLCILHLVWFQCYEKNSPCATLRCKNMCISMKSQSKLNLERTVI